MRIGQFDTDKKVLVVAEIGNNHEGSYTLAEELIGLAGTAGVDAVKFQTFKAEEFISPRSRDRFEQVKSFELSFEDFERLSRTATDAGLLFISTPLGLESAEFLFSIVSAFKIASGDNTFYPLLERVAGYGLPILLSGGLADLAQLKSSKAVIERVWSEAGIEQDLAVLHCVTSYPVEPEEANLAAIGNLRRALRCTVGYSDHTLDIEAAVLAVAQGARVIEKHFTIDKGYSAFRDHQLSADPQEMAELVLRIEHAVKLLGSGVKERQSCEKAIEKSIRRSIVARRDLARGITLAWGDLAWNRPGDGLAPGQEHLLLGRRLARSVVAGDPISLEMLEEE